MKNFKKTLALLAALALSATALYGCGSDKSSSDSAGTTNNSTTPDDKSSEGGTEESKSGDEVNGEDVVTILCWNSDDSQPMVDLFCKETGTSPDKFRLQNFQVQGGQASEQYDNYLGKASNDADIMFLEADWCLKYINDDEMTMPLSELGFSENDFDNLYGYVKEIGKSTVSGELKGISWQAAAGGFCYRDDLAKEYLGVETPEAMQEKVKDWDAFMATAKEVSEASGGKTALSATLGGVWQVYSGSRASAWVDKDNKLVVDDYCSNYAEYAKELWTNGYVTKVAQWNDAWKPLGTTNDTMGFFVSTWGFGDTILTAAAGGEGGATYGNWKCVVGPKEFYWGGTWMAPAKRCNNKDLAKKFIEFFTVNEETAKKYAIDKSEYMSNKNVMEAIIADKSSYSGAGVLGGQNQFEVLNEVAAGIDMAGKITPYDATIKTDFSAAVQEYCEGTTETAEAALESFKDRVAEHLPDLNWD